MKSKRFLISTVLILSQPCLVETFMPQASVKPIRTLVSSTSPSDPGNGDTTNDGDNNELQPIPRSAKPLDPLFVAVTRSDQPNAAKSVAVPLFGELALDKSLFVLLPVAAFALGGLVLSLVVLVNSSADDFATASIQDTSSSSSATTSASTQAACRGICSDQNSMQGLEQFMSRIPGK